MKHLIHAHCTIVDNGTPRLPNPSRIEYGEIAVNYANGHETLSIKNDRDDIVTFSSDKLWQHRIGDISGYWKNVEDSATTIDNIIDMLNYNRQYVIDHYQLKPVTLYETDGTTGLLGVNDSTINLNSWQLENLDFSPYRYVIAYFKQADRDLSTLQANYVTPSVMVFIPLDEASKSAGYNAYIGGTNATNPNDRNVLFCALAAIDETKTKFKVLSEHSIYGTTLGARNDNGRYCYKIEGHY